MRIAISTNWRRISTRRPMTRGTISKTSITRATPPSLTTTTRLTRMAQPIFHITEISSTLPATAGCGSRISPEWAGIHSWMVHGHLILDLDLAGSLLIHGGGRLITTAHGYSCRDTGGHGNREALGTLFIHSRWYGMLLKHSRRRTPPPVEPAQ